MKYVSVAEMIAIEKEANAGGLTYEIMMENAGRGLVEAILEEYGYLEERSVFGLVGSGNNGGDTLVALTYLIEAGWKASAYIVRPRPPDDPLVERLRTAGAAIFNLEDDPELEKLHTQLGEHHLFLDGVLGTGIRLPLKPELAQVLDNVRSAIETLESPPVVVAVDCPSGVDCDSGEAASECIPARLTVTMAAIKRGLLKFPAFKMVGDLRLVSIGLPDDGEALEAWRQVTSFVVDSNWVRRALPERPLDAHKGTFGTALVIAGSLNYTGAVLLAGEAAYRAGAGLVTLATPAPLHAALAGQLSEATWLLLPHDMGVIAESAAGVVRANLERVTAVLIGPGFGLEETSANFLSTLLTSGAPAGRRIGFVRAGSSGAESDAADLPPLVIDADGLKLLARIPDWFERLPAPAVLTPHPGEMGVLTGLSTNEIQGDRLSVAKRFSQEWGHVVVLKGAFTVIAAPDGRAAIIPVATPALARAGTGDVLAGLIVGLRAQGVEAFPAAAAGAWIHAQAGLLAAESLGNSASVLAGDVLGAAIGILGDLA
jgi:NAD(P)H-hydrate epimerase